MRYLNLLCHPLLSRCLNPDWIKCGRISLFVFVTRRSSVSNYQYLGIEDPMSCVRNFTDDDDDDDFTMLCDEGIKSTTTSGVFCWPAAWRCTILTQIPLGIGSRISPGRRSCERRNFRCWITSWNVCCSCFITSLSVLLFSKKLQAGPSKRGKGGFPGPRRLLGPAVAQKYWKRCSRQLLCDFKYA